MADAVVPITAGSGTNIKTYSDGSSQHVQYVRRHTAATMTLDAWTVSTTAATSRAAADESRVTLAFTNTTSGAVFLRPDSTAPTATTYFLRMDAGDFYEVEDGLVELAWSVLGSAGSTGSLLIWKGTA